MAHVDVRAIFGAPDVEAARHTAVIQLFEGGLHSTEFRSKVGVGDPYLVF